MVHDGGVRIGPLTLSSADLPYTTPGFTRFTTAHSIAAAGDAFITVSLAGSLFFSVSPEASRQQVLTYLMVTMAPFVVMAPFIGPAIDRFRRGHRWIAVVIYLTRAALCLALAYFLFTLLFYVLALALLIANKASGVLKSALVPGLVDDPHHLVAANSRLSRVTTIVGGSGGAAAASIAAMTSSSVTLVGAAVLFVVAASFAARLPRPNVHLTPEDEIAEQREFQLVHRPLITVSASAYTVIRFAVGAFVFGLAFALRRANEPAWMYGAAVVAYGVGAYLGNVLAPMARRRFGEDRLLAGALVGLGICAAFGAAGASRILIVFVSLVMGAATTFGRQGFDSLVQRQAPRELHGRSFARFETQFQLFWVLGAVFATAASVPARISLAVVAAVLLPSALLYLRAAEDARRFTPRNVGVDTAEEVFADVSAAVRDRLDAAEAWLERERPRLAAIDLAAALDLAAAAGQDIPRALAEDAFRVRRAALVRDVRIDESRVRALLSAAQDLARPEEAAAERIGMTGQVTAIPDRPRLKDRLVRARRSP